MDSPQQIDSILARYAELKTALEERERLAEEILRLARKRGFRRQGDLLLLGRRNSAFIVRIPDLVIPRHKRSAHWQISRVEISNSARVGEGLAPSRKVKK